MSKYRNACPAEFYDDDDTDDYSEPVQPPPGERSLANEFNLTDFEGIKIIPKLGVGAGINRSHFNINLDENAQKWFDQIFHCWKQCKYAIKLMMYQLGTNILM